MAKRYILQQVSEEEVSPLQLSAPHTTLSPQTLYPQNLEFLFITCHIDHVNNLIMLPLTRESVVIKVMIN